MLDANMVPLSLDQILRIIPPIESNDTLKHMLVHNALHRFDTSSIRDVDPITRQSVPTTRHKWKDREHPSSTANTPSPSKLLAKQEDYFPHSQSATSPAVVNASTPASKDHSPRRHQHPTSSEPPIKSPPQTAQPSLSANSGRSMLQIGRAHV